MHNIDVNDWKEFYIKDLFEFVKIVGDLKAQKQTVGNIPLVSSGKFNNGICMYISNPKEKSQIITKNKITVDMFGNSFFQEKDFYSVAHGRVNVLKPKFKINKYIGLFMATVIEENMRIKYGFSNMCSNSTLKKETVMLPQDEAGKPNWKYMNEFMKKMKTVAQTRIENLKKTDNIINPINSKDWGEFIIGEIFEIKRPLPRKISSYEKGKIPYVSSVDVNNGVCGYLTPKEDEMLEKGNCITVNPLDGTAFYQENDFLGRGGAGSSISILYNKNITKYNALFICTIITNMSKQFGYSDAFTSKNLRLFKLLLPKYKKEPDWDYMDKFMRIIESDAQNRIDIFNNNLKY